VTSALRCLFQLVRRSSHERFQLLFTGRANRSVRAAHDVAYAQNFIASTASPPRKFFARDPLRRRAAARSLTGSPFIYLHRSVSLPRRARLDQVVNSLFYQIGQAICAKSARLLARERVLVECRSRDGSRSCQLCKGRIETLNEFARPRRIEPAVFAHTRSSMSPPLHGPLRWMLLDPTTLAVSAHRRAAQESGRHLCTRRSNSLADQGWIAKHSSTASAYWTIVPTNCGCTRR
jgi:hypothetical protein